VLQLRAAYKYAIGAVTEGQDDIYTGLSAGFSTSFKTSKKGTNRLAIDYAYRTTQHFQGTHNIGVRYNIM
jgi:hypothetical protein